MKSSLVSATSLIALLAFDSEAAYGATMTLAPTTLNIYDLVGDGAPSLSFTEVVTITNQGKNTLIFGAVSAPTTIWGGSTASSSTKFEANAGSVSTSRTYTYQAATTASFATRTVRIIDDAAGTANDLTRTLTLVGRGVAPVAGFTGGNAGYTLVTGSKTVAATVTNSGNGNLSKQGTLSNLRGSVGSSSATTVFSGAGGTLTNVTNTTGLLDGGSQVVNYVFTPSQTGIATATVVGVFANGAMSPNGATNRATSITRTLTGTGVAPVGSMSVTNNGTANATAGTGIVGHVLVGNTANATITITNSGNGNLAGLGTINNLRGMIGAAGSSVFVGTGGALRAGAGLQDSHAGVGATTSQAFTYAFTPTTRGGVSTTVVTALNNGTGVGGANLAGNITTSLSGTGVAPVNSVTTSASSFVRIGTSSTATVSIANIGDGNKSGLGTIGNLRGTISTALSPAFTANPGNPTVLGAGGIGLADAASTTLGFTYTPVSHVAQTSTATISFVNGDTSGGNAAQTITATVSAQGVGPTYASKLNTVTNTPTFGIAGATVAATSTIPFGSLSSLMSHTVYLAIQNTTTDPDGGNAALTNLTLNDFSIWGGNAASFSVGLADGQVVSKGGQVFLPITVASGTALGLLTANLTVYSDEFSSLGGIGHTFTYALVATNVFEPASLAILGAGLAGLASVRRRRKTLPSA